MFVIVYWCLFRFLSHRGLAPLFSVALRPILRDPELGSEDSSQRGFTESGGNRPAADHHALGCKRPRRQRSPVVHLLVPTEEIAIEAGSRPGLAQWHHGTE